MDSDHREALKTRFAAIVGGENVLFAEDLLAEFSRQGGLQEGERPLCVVRPGNADQVQGIVQAAQELRLNLVPASSGPPRIKGGTRLDREGVVVDLSRMKRIMLVDRRNKVAVIEAGVTFPELKAKTDELGLKILMPLLPKAHKSVLASTLERDPILIPKYHWDTTDPLLCIEVVFGNGRLYRTGSAGGPGSIKQKIAAKSMFKNPLGPGQSDLAKIVQGSQGTMGIVTWGSVKLEVRPSIHRLYFVADDNLGRLVDFSYRVLRPKLADEFFLLNRRAFAAVIGADGSRIAEMTAGEREYVLVYGVSGYEVCAEERVAHQEADIRKIAQSVGVSIANRYMGIPGRRLEAILEAPSPEPYYRHRAKGAVQDIHFLTTLDQVDRFVRVASAAAEAHGYAAGEMGLYVQPILFGRACHVEFSFYFDPSDQGEVETVRSLYRKGSEALSEAGAFFSRPYGLWSELAYGRCPDTVRVLKQVKQIFDPSHVLNQGKLVFSEVA